MQIIELEAERLRSLRALASGTLRLKWLRAAARFEIAAHWHGLALKYGFNPAQPRVPRGNPDGGQWTDAGGGLGSLTRDGGQGASLRDYTKVAGGGRSSGSGGGRYGGNFPGSTFGQRVRLDQNIARTQIALQKIRQYDPNWQLRTENLTAPGSIEGSIRRSEARAEEAEAKLEQLRRGIGGNRGPSLGGSESRAPSSEAFDGQAWIDAYRTANNRPDLFGRPTWPANEGTVAVTEVNGRLYFGMNSGAPGYNSADRNQANSARWSLVTKDPYSGKSRNLGSIPNDSFYHAEATVLLRTARDNGGSLSGYSIEVHVDRAMCTSCDIMLPKLGLELGNPMVTFVDAQTGERSTMQDGRWLP